MRTDIPAAKCPRAGWVILDDGTRDYVVPTVCKTWGCAKCGNKVRQLTAIKMMYGCLMTGGASHFITVTYRKRPGDRIRNAKDVERDLAALWRRLGTLPSWAKLAWVKVPELTKAGQVHLHLIAVGLRGKDSCRVSPLKRLQWMQKPCSPPCLEHELAEAWSWVTEGVSFVVDVQVIRTVAGTCSYVQKYMSKMFGADRVRMDALGFAKRWSSSRNWPRCGTIKLLGTHLEAWDSVTRVHGSKATYAMHSEDEPVRMSDMLEDQELEAPELLRKVGDPYLMMLRSLGIRRKVTNEVMKGLGIEIA